MWLNIYKSLHRQSEISCKIYDGVLKLWHLWHFKGKNLSQNGNFNNFRNFGSFSRKFISDKELNKTFLKVIFPKNECFLKVFSKLQKAEQWKIKGRNSFGLRECKFSRHNKTKKFSKCLDELFLYCQSGHVMLVQTLFDIYHPLSCLWLTKYL